MILGCHGDDADIYGDMEGIWDYGDMEIFKIEACYFCIENLIHIIVLYFIFMNFCLRVQQLLHQVFIKMIIVQMHFICHV